MRRVYMPFLREQLDLVNLHLLASRRADSGVDLNGIGARE